MRRRDFLRGSIALAGTGALGLAPAGGGAAVLDALRERRPGSDSGGRGDGPIRLASNENPLGLSPAARRAVIDGLSEGNRYPHLHAAAFRPKLAEFHGVPAESVVLGNGSTEVIQMAVQALARPGMRYVIPDPTFENVADYEAPSGLELVKVPLLADWSHDLQRMRELAGRGPALVYICNPNNPTASLTSTADVAAWIADAPEQLFFLVDEAYIHFVDVAGHETAIPLALERPNVVVTRTFSKIYGMAGLRLGYGIAQAETAKRLSPYAADVNTNQLALFAAEASLQDEAYVEEAKRTNEAGRRVLYGVLDELGLERIPSHANFVMHRVAGELGAYIDRMAQEGVRVGRPFPPLLGWNRVSIGLPREMQRHAEVLRAFRSRGWV